MEDDYGQVDRDYWNDKYDVESGCEEHEEDEMYYDWSKASYYCLACQLVAAFDEEGEDV